MGNQTYGYGLNIFLFSFTRFITELGSGVYKFALALYIADVTGSSAAFATVLGFSYLPGVLINIFAGAYIDRHNKKTIMVVTELLSGALVLLFLLFFLQFPTNLWLFVGYAFLISTIQAFTYLALQASIPELVDEDRVGSMNSIYQAISAILNVAGPLVGAVAYGLLGMEMILLIDGLSFIGAGIMQMFLRFRKTEAVQETTQSYTDTIKEVFQYIREQVVIKYLFLIFLVLNFIFPPLMYVGLLHIAYRVEKVSMEQFSFIQSSWFIGIIIGAAVVSMKKVSKYVENKIFLLIQLQGLLLLTWVFPIFVPETSNASWIITGVFVSILLVSAIFNSMGNIPIFTFVQLNTPEHLRASMFGVVGTFTGVAVPFGIWLYGILLEAVHWTYLVLASGAIIFVIALIAHLNKQVSQYFKKKEEQVVATDKSA
ncbi:MFS transporter [Brevibacillus fortis]|uniref:MFS transporter n=1 Tax=Brevibacillus fortis TaxID=2126352 RepID=UPI0038FCE316